MTFVIDPRQFGSPQNPRVLVVIPHWDTAYWPYEIFARFFAKDFRVLVYYYSENLLSADIGATTRFMSFFEKRILSDISEMPCLELIGVLGVSLGSTIATRIANTIAAMKNPPALRLALAMSGASFPFAVWHGASTQHIKTELANSGVDLPFLNAAWKRFSPIENLEFLKKRGAPILFFGSVRDQTLHPVNVKAMARRLQEEHSHARIVMSKLLGHRAVGIVSMARIGLIKKFLLGGTS